MCFPGAKTDLLADASAGLASDNLRELLESRSAEQLSRNMAMGMLEQDALYSQQLALHFGLQAVLRTHRQDPAKLGLADAHLDSIAALISPTAQPFLKQTVYSFLLAYPALLAGGQHKGAAKRLAEASLLERDAPILAVALELLDSLVQSGALEAKSIQTPFQQYLATILPVCSEAVATATTRLVRQSFPSDLAVRRIEENFKATQFVPVESVMGFVALYLGVIGPSHSADNPANNSTSNAASNAASSTVATKRLFDCILADRLPFSALPLESYLGQFEHFGIAGQFQQALLESLQAKGTIRQVLELPFAKLAINETLESIMQAQLATCTAPEALKLAGATEGTGAQHTVAAALDRHIDGILRDPKIGRLLAPIQTASSIAEKLRQRFLALDAEAQARILTLSSGQWQLAFLEWSFASPAALECLLHHDPELAVRLASLQERLPASILQLAMGHFTQFPDQLSPDLIGLLFSMARGGDEAVQQQFFGLLAHVDLDAALVTALVSASDGMVAAWAAFFHAHPQHLAVLGPEQTPILQAVFGLALSSPALGHELVRALCSRILLFAGSQDPADSDWLAPLIARLVQLHVHAPGDFDELQAVLSAYFRSIDGALLSAFFDAWALGPAPDSGPTALLGAVITALCDDYPAVFWLASALGIEPSQALRARIDFSALPADEKSVHLAAFLILRDPDITGSRLLAGLSADMSLEHLVTLVRAMHSSKVVRKLFVKSDLLSFVLLRLAAHLGELQPDAFSSLVVFLGHCCRVNPVSIEFWAAHAEATRSIIERGLDRFDRDGDLAVLTGVLDMLAAYVDQHDPLLYAFSGRLYSLLVRQEACAPLLSGSSLADSCLASLGRIARDYIVHELARIDFAALRSLLGRTASAQVLLVVRFAATLRIDEALEGAKLLVGNDSAVAAALWPWASFLEDVSGEPVDLKLLVLVDIFLCFAEGAVPSQPPARPANPLVDRGALAGHGLRDHVQAVWRQGAGQVHQAAGVGHGQPAEPVPARVHDL